jgi:hypothetical protein
MAKKIMDEKRRDDRRGGGKGIPVMITLAQKVD